VRDLIALSLFWRRLDVKKITLLSRSFVLFRVKVVLEDLVFIVDLLLKILFLLVSQSHHFCCARLFIVVRIYIFVAKKSNLVTLTLWRHSYPSIFCFSFFCCYILQAFFVPMSILVLTLLKKGFMILQKVLLLNQNLGLWIHGLAFTRQTLLNHRTSSLIVLTRK